MGINTVNVDSRPTPSRGQALRGNDDMLRGNDGGVRGNNGWAFGSDDKIRGNDHGVVSKLLMVKNYE